MTDRPKQLAQHRAADPQQNAVRDAVRARQARDTEHRKSMASAVTAGFFGNLLDRMFGAGPVKAAYRGHATSKRSATEILATLRQFYGQRPRPWRPARCAPKQPRLEVMALQRRGRQ